MKKKRETKGWTPERREKYRQAIRQQKPWEHSTGPRTEAGKNIARYNAWWHGMDSAAINNLRQVLHLQRFFTKLVMATAMGALEKENPRHWEEAHPTKQSRLHDMDYFAPDDRSQ
jgi:hypothetical protein